MQFDFYGIMCYFKTKCNLNEKKLKEGDKKMCQHHFKLKKEPQFRKTPTVKGLEHDKHNLEAEVYCQHCLQEETIYLGYGEFHWAVREQPSFFYATANCSARFPCNNHDFELIKVVEPKHGSEATIFMCMRCLTIQTKFG